MTITAPPPPVSTAVGPVVFIACVFLGSVVPKNGTVVEKIQFMVLLSLALFFAVVIQKLSTPSPQTLANRVARLHTAMTKDPLLSDAWYTRAGALLGHFVVVALAGVVFGLVFACMTAYPGTAVADLFSRAQVFWDDMRTSYTDFSLFVVVNGVLFLASYWGISLLYLILDVWRPASLLPYKTQRDYVLTKADFLRGATLVLCNQALAIPVIFGIYFVLPYTSPDMFSAQLPTLISMLMHLLIFKGFAELIFYSSHHLLHKEFMFTYIHYIHHTWKAPIALTAIYCHPVEFLLGNVTIIVIPPLVLGSHCFVWWLWAIVSTLDTCHGHSGWHLPFLGSMEFHDYHHLKGYENMGITGLLDYFFNTNSVYINSWYTLIDKNYSSPDYPVDKVLAPAALEDDASLLKVQTAL